MKRNRIIIALLAVVLAFTSIPNLGLLDMPSKVEAEGIPSSGNWDADGVCTYTFSNGILTISPGSGTEIKQGQYADSLKDLVTTVIVFDGIEKIGEYAFCSYKKMRSVSIPDSVTTIGDRAFLSTGISQITIPDSVTTIGDSAFSYSKLVEIIIPASVSSIGDRCFCCCSELKNINVENGNSYYKSIDGVLYDGTLEELIFCPQDSPLTSLSIPESVVTIDTSAIDLCYNIIEISMGRNVASIAEGAFQLNNHAVSISVAEENENYKSENGILYNKNLTKVICCHIRGNIILPQSVTEVADYAFYLSPITEITFPNNLTTIGDYAFNGCWSLKQVVLPNSIASIGMAAFCGCSNLTEVSVPSGITRLDYNVFQECRKLERVDIPNTVTSIGHSAFCACDSLIDVYYDGTLNEWNELLNHVDEERNGDLFNATIHFNDGTVINERNYTVKYNANGGTGSMTNQGLTCGVEQNLKANAFIRTGYTFTGWNTKADGTGTNYADKESVVNLTTTNGETVNLYAQWKINTFTVTFDMNGHGTAPANQVVGYGSKITQPSTPSAEGYYFSGWYKEAPGVTPWRFSVDTVTSNVTLYAKWTPQPAKEPEVEEPTPVVEAEPTEEPAQEEPALPENMNDNGDGTYKVEDPDLGETIINAAVVAEGIVYRMYNPNSGEHFYTKDASERENLLKNGWNYEENASFETISATEDGAVPVYRVYNPNSGLHHYTMSKDEALMLKDLGWNYEGISLYVYDADSEFGTPEYRLYNENDGHHHWTVDSNERDALVALGWNDEGIAWRVK